MSRPPRAKRVSGSGPRSGRRRSRALPAPLALGALVLLFALRAHGPLGGTVGCSPEGFAQTAPSPHVPRDPGPPRPPREHRAPHADRVTLAALPRPPHPHAFENAKHLLERTVYDGADRREIYCGCAYDAHKRIDFAACEDAHPYAPAARESERALRMEWDHILPASWIGHELPCWSEAVVGHQSHREHCRVTSEAFANAEGDMHNLLPAIGQLNALREDFSYGELEGERHLAGCDFELEAGLVEPRPAVRGAIARAMLYAAATYGVPLEPTLLETLRAWDAAHPPDAWELERNRRIAAIQGNGNPFIERPLAHGP